MIKTNTFRIYDGKTFEKVNKLGTDYNNNFFDESKFFLSNEENIIICGSYYLYNYLQNKSLRVFEGDILRVVVRDVRM